MTDILEQLSNRLADHIAAVAGAVVAIETERGHISGIVWRPDVVVTSAQMLPDRADFTLYHAGAEHAATVTGRDAATNIAVLRPAAPITAALPDAAPLPRVGTLALLVGADDEGGPTGRLAMVHATGPEWHSQTGGRIDALLRLDARISAEEGGPVLDAAGGLLGMSTSGPRRRTLVIPAATIRRVLEPLLADGRVARGWLGVGLQPVMIPDGLREAAGRDSGMMVMKLAAGGPAATAGVMPGDILLDLDGVPISRPRGLAAAMAPEKIGTTVAMRLLRGGVVQSVSLTITARPAA